ncbi:MAG: DUF2007 domain-containing protein [Bacteroidales bacterium]|nr:DUF2007 domain-containing protein [Candidatus Equibacterium intestinale]
MQVVRRYTSPMDAHIDASLLEGEGIMCEVLNENLVFVGLGASAGFDVRLVVDDEDYERASSILAASHSCE